MCGLKNLSSRWVSAQDDPSLYGYNLPEKLDLFVEYVTNQVRPIQIHVLPFTSSTFLPGGYTINIKFGDLTERLFC